MQETQLLQRITSDPRVLLGKPVIRGTRLSVEFVLGLLGSGATCQEILSEYNGLTVEDIQACQLFASKYMADATFMPLNAETI